MFLVNLIVTIWASSKFGLKRGIGTIQDGDCHETKNLSLWPHLTINVLGTMLLSASNYCMQCLSAPTREEINKAHARNIWLDIGVPSVRNLWRMTRRKLILWWLLALTSLPLHLMYNSAVFDNLASRQSIYFVVSEGLLSGAVSEAGLLNMPGEYWVRLEPLRVSYSNDKLDRLENQDCITIYGKEFISKNADFLAVTWTHANSTATLYNYGVDPKGLVCPSSGPLCDPQILETQVKKAQSWKAGDHYPIEYCLSQPIAERCKLQFSLPILLIVTICNLVKTVCTVLILVKERSQPLVTLGDAISSFLMEPDSTTRNACLADKYRFRKDRWPKKIMVWHLKSHRWFNEASWKRWLACNLL